MKKILLFWKAYAVFLSCLDLLASYFYWNVSNQKSLTNFEMRTETSSSLQFSQSLMLLKKPSLALSAFVFMFLIAGQSSWGQTNPTAFDLSTGNFSFTGFASGTTTSYPANMQGNSFASEPLTAVTGSPNADFVLAANTGVITSGSIRNEIASGISILNSGSNNLGAIVLAINTTNRSSLTVTYTAQQTTAPNSGGTGRANTLRLQYRIGTTGAFTDISSTDYVTTNTTTANAATTFSNISIPSVANNNAVVQLRWIYYTSSGTTGSRNRIRLDDITVSSSVAATPTITGATTATAFTTTYGTASAAQTFSVSGTALTANLVATAPTGFEVSSDGTNFGTTASFTQTSGSASGTLSVRLRANAAVTGSYNSQNIVLSSTGATSVNIVTASSGNAVAAKALTITANNRTKVYNTSLTLGTSAFTFTGISNSETIGSVTLTAAEAASLTAGAGTHAIVPSGATGGTFTASNYLISYVNGTLTITPANQTIAAITSAVTKNYGDAAYSIATTATSGLAVSYSSSNSGIASVALNGTVTILLPGTVTLTASQAGDSNYNAATSVTQTLTITAKGLTISGLSASNKNFDGNTDAIITGTPSLVGVVGTDDVSLIGTVVGAFASSSVGTGIAVSVTGYSLNGTTASNYTLTQPTLSADIIANTPTLFTTGTLAAVNTTYGSASATPSSFNVNAQSLTDVITIAAPTGFEVSTSSASGYASSITVGGAGSVSSTPIYVRLTATNAVGTYSGNITLDSPDAVQVTIATASSSVAPKELSIIGITGVDKTYDTTTTATVTGTPSLVGVVGSDNVTLNSSSVTYNFANSNAGIAKPITVLGYTLNGTSASNYTVAQPTGLTATISKAASSISVTGSSSFTYNTTAQGPTNSNVLGSTGTVTYSYNGVSPTVYGPSSTRPTNAGTYTVTATVAADINYETATSADFSFIIDKAEQTITLASTDAKTTSTTTYSLIQNASSGLAIVYASSNAAVATVSGNTVTIVGIGSTTITANQVGDTNYNAAPQITQELIVTQGVSVLAGWDFFGKS